MAYVNEYKEVLFGIYCEKCENFKKNEFEKPCDECLANPLNLNSRIPIKFKEKEK